MNCDAVYMRPLPSRGLPFAVRRKIQYGSPAIRRTKYARQKKEFHRLCHKKKSRSETPLLFLFYSHILEQEFTEKYECIKSRQRNHPLPAVLFCGYRTIYSGNYYF